MTKNLDILNAAVSRLIKAALLAVRFSGRIRRRSMKRLAAMDADAKAKEILFLKDKVHQLEMQVPDEGFIHSDAAEYPTVFPHEHLPPYHLFKEHSLEIRQFSDGPTAA